MLLQLDNTTAVAYINNLGGTVSHHLTLLARRLWMWCLERDISLTAQHLPGVLNTVADSESRVMRDRTDWQLNPIIFQQINRRLGPLEVDLFASRLTAHLPRYFSWRPDPLAEGTDAFLQDWSHILGFANPPWCLLGRVLAQVHIQQAQVILIAPVWKTQPWYPVLLNMLVSMPLLIQRQPQEVFLEVHRQSPVEVRPQPAVWPISGIDSETKAEQSSALLLASWRTKTSRSYDSLFQKCVSWCSERSTDPISGPVSDVVNFLGDLYAQGYQYRSLNSYRSAISSVHDQVDGCPVGQHPLVSRVLKGVFNSRPPLPRYVGTWDIQVVLTFIEGLGPSRDLSLLDLSLKLAMLLALTRPSRSADLCQLKVTRRRYTPDGVIFAPAELAKQSRPGRVLVNFFFPSFRDNELLCPVHTLRVYEDVTSLFRSDQKPGLFLATIKPHNPVTSSTIARWLHTVMERAGVDTSVFKAHSVRGASTSAAANVGVTTQDILNAADWRTESVFKNSTTGPLACPLLAQQC